MKIASDDKCFNASIDYMHLSFQLDPINTDIVKMLDDYLNRYTYLSSRHTLLCLVISYQLLNKKDIAGAYKYIDELLDIKVAPFVRRMLVSSIFTICEHNKIDLDYYQLLF